MFKCMDHPKKLWGGGHNRFPSGICKGGKKRFQSKIYQPNTHTVVLWYINIGFYEFLTCRWPLFLISSITLLTLISWYFHSFQEDAVWSFKQANVLLDFRDPLAMVTENHYWIQPMWQWRVLLSQVLMHQPHLPKRRMLWTWALVQF